MKGDYDFEYGTFDRGSESGRLAKADESIEDPQQRSGTFRYRVRTWSLLASGTKVCRKCSQVGTVQFLEF